MISLMYFYSVMGKNLIGKKAKCLITDIFLIIIKIKDKEYRAQKMES